MPDFDPGSHPDTETLARYVHGALGRGDSRALERHLAGCLDCQATVEEIPAPAGAVVHWAGHRFAGRGEPHGDSPYGEEEAARRARLHGTLAEIASVLGALGEGFAARLLTESEHGRRALIRGDRRFQSTAVCAALLARCREAWFEDPAGAVELGKLAVAVAGHLPSQGASSAIDGLEAGGAPDPRPDAWKALAWMHLGNAYRIASGGGTPPASRAELAEAPPAGGPAPRFSGSTGVAGVAAAGTRGSFLGEGPARSEEAETALREVGEAFLERGLAAEAAMVVLETATVRLRQGRPGEIAPLAEAAAARLEGAGAGPEALAAVRRLREAAGRGEITGAWLDAAVAALRRTREDPGREPR